MLRATCALTLCLVSFAATAVGQERQSYVPYASPNSVPGSPAALGYRQSATAAESYLRGEADWMRGYGEMVRDLGETNCYNQTAYAQLLQNKRYQYDFQKYKEHIKRDELLAAKAARQAKYFAAKSAYRISTGPRSFVSADGTISWTEAFDMPESVDARRTLESVFAAKASSDGRCVSAIDTRSARKAISQLRELLKARIKALDSRDYMAAKALLRDLANGLASSPKPIQLAQN